MHCRNHKPLALRIHSFIAKTVTQTTITYQFEEQDHLVQSLSFNHCPLEVKRGFQIVGCSNGVVCVSLSRPPQIYALWNPSTRQVRVIADCPLNGNAYCSGFCFDPVTNSFNLSQIELTLAQEEEEEEEEERRVQVHVFPTSTNSWTEKNMTVPYPIGINFKITDARCVNGYLHWHVVIFRPGSELEEFFTCHDTIKEELEDTYILTYDIVNEAFGRIELPFPHVYAQYCLAAYKGSLSLFVLHSGTASNFSSSVIDVWVMNDHGGSWSKILTSKPSIEVTYVVPSMWWHDVKFILLCSEPNSAMYLYDPLTGETKDPLERDRDRDPPTIERFLDCESLVSLN